MFSQAYKSYVINSGLLQILFIQTPYYTLGTQEMFVLSCCLVVTDALQLCRINLYVLLVRAVLLSMPVQNKAIVLAQRFKSHLIRS